MLTFNIYSQSQSSIVLETYMETMKLDAAKKNELRDFIRTLYAQNLFLGHKGEVIPHLSRAIF